MVPEIWGATDRIFCHFGSFLSLFTPLTTWKIKILKKMKKVPGDITILQLCTQNDNHIRKLCNLPLTQGLWATKLYPRASKVSKICLFGHQTGQATSWKANFENYSRYSLIKYYQLLSIQYNMSNMSFRFKYTFLLSACSSQSHATSCLSLMFHNRVNNKRNRVKERRWRWLIYVPHNFLRRNNMLRVFRSSQHCSWKFHKLHKKTPPLEPLFKKVSGLGPISCLFFSITDNPCYKFIFKDVICIYFSVFF